MVARRRQIDGIGSDSPHGPRGDFATWVLGCLLVWVSFAIVNAIVIVHLRGSDVQDERRGIRRRSHCLATVKQNGTHTSRGIRPLLGTRLPRRCFYSDCRRRHTHPRSIAHFHGNRGGRWQRHRWYWLVAAAAPSFRGYGVWSQGGLFVDSNSSAPIVGIIFGQKAASKVDKYSRASTNASTCPRTIRGSDETSATSI